MAGDGFKFKPNKKVQAEHREAREKAREGESEAEKAEEEDKEEDDPAICDVAPTILDIMVRISYSDMMGAYTDYFRNQGLPIPEEMTGRSLLAH